MRTFYSAGIGAYLYIAHHHIGAGIYDRYQIAALLREVDLLAGIGIRGEGYIAVLIGCACGYPVLQGVVLVCAEVTRCAARGVVGHGGQGHYSTCRIFVHKVEQRTVIGAVGHYHSACAAPVEEVRPRIQQQSGTVLIAGRIVASCSSAFVYHYLAHLIRKRAIVGRGTVVIFGLTSRYQQQCREGREQNKQDIFSHCRVRLRKNKVTKKAPLCSNNTSIDTIISYPTL